MIEDMTVRGFSAGTQQGYIRAVRDFTVFFGCSPHRANAEDLRRYQLHMRTKGASATSMNAAVSALRFFFGVTLDPEKVGRLLDAAPGLKYKAAFNIAYGAGLRASEMISLKLGDIPRGSTPRAGCGRKVIRAELGKGRRDRYAMPSDPLLDLLRVWWREARLQGWLFPGRNVDDSMDLLICASAYTGFHGSSRAYQNDENR